MPLAHIRVDKHDENTMLTVQNMIFLVHPCSCKIEIIPNAPRLSEYERESFARGVGGEAPHGGGMQVEHVDPYYTSQWLCWVV